MRMLTQAEYEAGEGSAEERSFFLEHYLRQRVIDQNPKLTTRGELPIKKGLLKALMYVVLMSALILGIIMGIVYAVIRIDAVTRL